MRIVETVLQSKQYETSMIGQFDVRDYGFYCNGESIDRIVKGLGKVTGEDEFLGKLTIVLEVFTDEESESNGID